MLVGAELQQTQQTSKLGKGGHDPEIAVSLRSESCQSSRQQFSLWTAAAASSLELFRPGPNLLGFSSLSECLLYAGRFCPRSS